MNFDEKLQELRNKNSQIISLKKEIKNISENLFDDFRLHIFDKYPQLNSFGWTQYTPYFNDGETCVFSANTDYLIINEQYAEDSDWFSDVKIINWGQWNFQLKTYEGRVEEPNLDYNKELVSAYNEIVEFLSNFDDDFYLSRFGDHAEITITKNSVEISDCEHD